MPLRWASAAARQWILADGVAAACGFLLCFRVSAAHDVVADEVSLASSVPFPFGDDLLCFPRSFQSSLHIAANRGSPIWNESEVQPGLARASLGTEGLGDLLRVVRP